MHAEHADEPAWFIGMGHAFDLQAWLAKIKQQAKLRTGRFQIIGALHSMRVVECFDSLQFDRRTSSIICQRIVIETLAPSASSKVNAQPITCADNSFISLLSACFTCIVFLHLR
jgi:hypothetical protein